MIFVVLCIASLAHAATQVGGGTNTPINITSDRFDVYSEKRIAVFSGNVVVTQEDTTIQSDEFYLHYYKPKEMTARKKSQVINAGAAANMGEIQKIEAKGHVIIRQQEKILTGENAVFFNEERKIIVTGTPEMREGDNIIKGDKITFFLTENRGVVESSKETRVTATIYPEKQ